ncbi:MAG: thiol reductant ABC exporter subunit CydC [Actinomycetota bacterium]|nr:thiol reductant ABC exporter subunit CydC [Actinomycetota bacterium]
MTVRTYWRLLRPWKRQLAVALGAAVGAVLCSVTLAGTAAWLIATAAGRVPVLTLLVAIVAVRACGFGRAALTYLQRLSGHDAVLRMLGVVREQLVFGLAALIRRGAVRPGDADALARVTADVDDLQDALLRGVLPYLSSVVVSLCAVLAAAVLLPAAGAALAGCLLIAVLLVPLLTARSAATGEALAVRLRADRDRRIAEMLDSAADLVVTGRWDDAAADLAAADRADLLVRRRHSTAAGLTVAVAVLATGLAGWLAAAIGLSAVHAGRLDPVLLAVLVLMPFALTDPLAASGECARAIGRTRAAAGRVLQLVEAATGNDPEIGMGADDGGAIGPEGASLTRVAMPVIRLHAVCARWPGSSRDDLHDINLELRAGNRVAVVGPSGSGKSTLIAVLLGLQPIRSGVITIDGRPATGEQLRSLMSWLPADPHLFDSTIERNIRIGIPTAELAAVDSACAAAGLTAWLRRLPNGSATKVGERGLAVSGGERQRIALARALLADRPVLLADEPAAHLDGPTADAVTASVLARDPLRCTVLVTHREADLGSVDAALRLELGQDQPASIQDQRASGETQPASMETRPPVASVTAM